MKIIISGYGRMGKEIEKQAIAEGHTIVFKIDNQPGWEILAQDNTEADVVIDFSQPDTAIDNILNCFQLGIPIVSGTTGWIDQLEYVTKECAAQQGSLFHAPNFSIGVNLFFLMNTRLASLMSSFEDYKVSIKEVHHIHKLDAPSGTAIKVAEDIIDKYESLDNWVNRPEFGAGLLPVFSEREGEVPGTHIVSYESAADLIELKHKARNRTGFAKGAILAAKWLVGKKGVFTMGDLLKSIL